MGLVDSFGMPWPPVPMIGGVSATTNLSSVGHSFIVVFRAPKTGSITHIGFGVQTLTSPSSLNVTAALQGVNATTGNADGSNYGGSAPSSNIPIAATGQYEGALSTPASVSEGDLVSAVVTIASGTVSALAFRLQVGSIVAMPYYGINAASFTKVPVGNSPALTIKYSGEYVPIFGVSPIIEDAAATTFNSGSSPSRRALKWTPPFSCEITGAWGFANLSNNSDLVIYDSASSALQTIALDKDINYGASGIANTFRYTKFTSPISITAGSVVRLSWNPGGSDITTYDYRFDGTYAGTGLENLPGGTSLVLSTWNGSVWTDSTTRRLIAGFILSKVHDGSGGGGIRTARGMNGGFPR